MDGVWMGSRCECEEVEGSGGGALCVWERPEEDAGRLLRSVMSKDCWWSWWSCCETGHSIVKSVKGREGTEEVVVVEGKRGRARVRKSIVVIKR